MIIYSPAFVQEAVDMTYKAFDIAEKYRTGVGILTESSLGHLIEGAEMPPYIDPATRELPDWRRTGERPETRKKNNRGPITLNSKGTLPGQIGNKAGSMLVNVEKQALIKENEQQWENIGTEDAEYIFVSFGMPARMCMSAVQKMRAKGEKIGLIRLKTLWPYPVNALKELNFRKVKAFICMETNATAQMSKDLMLANIEAYGRDYIPIYSSLFFEDRCPTTKFIMDTYRDVKERKATVKVVF